MERLMALGLRLKGLRVERGLSVRKLADRAGVSVSYIYAIESGHRGSNMNKLERIAGALGVQVAMLWSGDLR